MFRKKLVIIPLACISILLTVGIFTACTAKKSEQISVNEYSASVQNDNNQPVSNLQANIAPSQSASLADMTDWEIEFMANDLIFRADKFYFGYLNSTEFADLWKKLIDNQGITWYLVADYHTIKELKDATQKIFSKKFCTETLYPMFGPETIKFKEIDGKLYVTDNVGGIGSVNYLLMNTMDIKQKNADKIVVTVANAVPPMKGDEKTEIEYVDFAMIKENENWVLEQYPL